MIGGGLVARIQSILAASLAQGSGSDAAGGALMIGFICFWILFVAGAFALWIWSIIHAVKNPRLSDNSRIVWVLVIVLVGPIGSLIYLIAGRGG